MLQPKRMKYRKMHRGRRKGKAIDGYYLAFGEYGLKALESAWITANQIEACRLAIGRFLKKGGKLWIRIFPDKPVTKKPAETRMGKGKGNVDHYVAPVKRGKILFELAGVPEESARRAFEIASHKLPIKTRFVSYKEGGV
ncbi:MAG: 50S ribosomal protein L16 [candidate division WOR-3 bacterium]